MNFIFMIILVLLILLFFNIYIKKIPSHFYTFILLIVLIINELYFYKKIETFESNCSPPNTIDCPATDEVNITWGDPSSNYPIKTYITVGTKVIWKSTPDHTVTSDNPDDVIKTTFNHDFGEELSFEHTFIVADVGEFQYKCMKHTNMTGIVIVSDVNATNNCCETNAQTTATTMAPTTATTMAPTTATTMAPTTATTMAPTTATTMAPTTMAPTTSTSLPPTTATTMAPTTSTSLPPTTASTMAPTTTTQDSRTFKTQINEYMKCIAKDTNSCYKFKNINDCTENNNCNYDYQFNKCHPKNCPKINTNIELDWHTASGALIQTQKKMLSNKNSNGCVDLSNNECDNSNCESKYYTNIYNYTNNDNNNIEGCYCDDKSSILDSNNYHNSPIIIDTDLINHDLINAFINDKIKNSISNQEGLNHYGLEYINSELKLYLFKYSFDPSKYTKCDKDNCKTTISNNYGIRDKYIGINNLIIYKAETQCGTKQKLINN